MKISENSYKLLLFLKSKNFIVKKPEKFISFLFNYGTVRMIDGYLSLFIDENKNNGSYIDGIDDIQLINLVKLDRKIANLIGDYIMLFEQQFCDILIQLFLKNNNLKSNFHLDLNNFEPYLNFESEAHEENFKHNIYLYTKQSNFLKNEDFSETKIPLSKAALSWTLNTMNGFFRAIKEEIKQEILVYFKADDLTIKEFSDVLNIVRNLRNSIFHNDIIFSTNFYDNKNVFSKLTKITKQSKIIGIFDIVVFLQNHINDKFDFLDKNITKKIATMIKKSNFKPEIERYIKKIMNWKDDFDNE